MKKIKYYKPTWPLDLIQVGDSIGFKWHKRWVVLGKTKKGYLKLQEDD